jgi:hypothetical protein
MNESIRAAAIDRCGAAEEETASVKIGILATARAKSAQTLFGLRIDSKTEITAALYIGCPRS